MKTCSGILESSSDIPSERKAPLVSVVTVCRNSGETIGATFQSLLDQDFAGMESVVVDGNSTDNTLEIVKAYQGKFAAKGIEMIVISEPDDGIYDAMNKGIARCRGELIGILNSDDYYEPGALGVVLASIEEDPEAEIVYGFMRYLDGERETNVSRYNFEYMYSKNNKSGMYSGAGHPTCFVRRAVYEEIGHFDVRFRTAADLDFLMRSATSGKKFKAVDAILTNFSIAGVSGTISSHELDGQKIRILHKNKLIDDDEFNRRARQLQLGERKRKIRKFINMLTGR